MNPGDAGGHTVHRIGVELLRTISQVLPGGQPVALLNFPNHGNPGDPAIWLGTRRTLERLGCRVAYASSWASFDMASLQSALPDGPVLLNGGGNFGDLYGPQQALRERVFQELRGRRVIQLPQSIYFRDRMNLDRVRRLVDDHGDVVLMTRERSSQEFAKRHFEAQVELCPDMAFGLGSVARPRTPNVDVVWLQRREGDPEYVDHGPAPAGPDVRLVEWLDGVAEDERSWDRAGRVALLANARLTEQCRRGGTAARLAWRPLVATFEPLAARWVARGVDILAQGRVVVTDKLHGHILALLLGLPHVVMDNSYGKVRATVETWTLDDPAVHWSEESRHAATVAAQLVEAVTCGSS